MEPRRTVATASPRQQGGAASPSGVTIPSHVQTARRPAFFLRSLGMLRYHVRTAQAADGHDIHNPNRRRGHMQTFIDRYTELGTGVDCGTAGDAPR